MSVSLSVDSLLLMPNAAEAWWVDSLVRNPVIIPYTLGPKRLDNIYLDTTFATKSNIYATFPSKAQGISELLEKVGRYPDDTIFYLRSWTFGYEEVWLALSNALNSPVSWLYPLFVVTADAGAIDSRRPIPAWTL